MSDSFIAEVTDLQAKSEEIYIYGMGMYGNNIYNYLTRCGIEVDGFVVSNKPEDCQAALRVREIRELVGKNVGIILGLSTWNKEEVLSNLDKLGFEHKNVVDGGRFLDKGGSRSGHDKEPVLEITTRIGCSIDCRYCPQRLFYKEYFKENRARNSVMSMETFKTCIEKMPDNTSLVFSGMAEPFLNTKCIDMIKIGCEKGRKVDLFTTLVGADMDMVKEISLLPLNRLVLHVADKMGYAKIHTSESYYRKIEYLINAKKADGETPLVSLCNAQAEPDERVKEICEGKYEILTTMLDRAGNLEGEELLSKKQEKGCLSCTLCGTLANRNVLLPDGSLLLCCMDFGMKHVLGNLLEQSYEDILSGDEVLYIREGLRGNIQNDILCRKCTNARVICEEESA